MTAERLIDVVEPWARRAAEKGTDFDLCSLIPAYRNDDLRSVTPRIFLALAALHRGRRDQALRLLEDECRRADSSEITITDQSGRRKIPANRFAHALADWLALTGEEAASGAAPSLSPAESQSRALAILTRKYGQGLALKAALWLARPEACIQSSGLISHFQRQNFTLEAPVPGSTAADSAASPACSAASPACSAASPACSAASTADSAANAAGSAASTAGKPARRSTSSHLEAYEKISARLAHRAAAFHPDYPKLAENFK